MLHWKKYIRMTRGPLVLVLVVVFFITVGFSFTIENETSGSVPQVVIDGDPGADDAMAIFMLLADPSKANVLAITVSTGNTGSANATRNARLVLEVANRSDIPVYSGSEQGMVYYEESDHFFGYDGLGDEPEWNQTNLYIPNNKHAAVALADIIRERPGQVTLLATGPLTNIGLALHLNPKLLHQVKQVVILGGSYKGGGNVKPGVEFNAYADPEAATLVFSHIPEGKPVTLVPIETIRAAAISKDWRKNVLGGLDNCIMDFLNKAERISLPKVKVWQPFDQTAASIILEPEVVSATEDAFIRVETCGDLGRGAFFRDDKSTVKNTKIVTKVNKPLLKEILLTYLNTTTGVCL